MSYLELFIIPIYKLKKSYLASIQKKVEKATGKDLIPGKN